MRRAKQNIGTQNIGKTSETSGHAEFNSHPMQSKTPPI